MRSKNIAGAPTPHRRCNNSAGTIGARIFKSRGCDCRTQQSSKFWMSEGRGAQIVLFADIFLFAQNDSQMTNLQSLFIVGCGRNGTSVCAGLFRQTGLFMGDRLHPPSDANPRGYFEDAQINELNNRILLQYVPSGPLIYRGIEYRRDCPERRHAWLARISLDTEIITGPSELSAIEQWTRRAPFCYKDPRFCYVLHLWRRSIPTAKRVCVFRNPVTAVGSILHNCQTHPPLADFAISVNQAFEIWTLCYERVVQHHTSDGEWFFVDYEHLLDGRALNALERFAGLAVDRSFPNHAYNRASASFSVPPQTSRIYALLRERADACY
jgi:Sulfotransferase family